MKKVTLVLALTIGLSFTFSSAHAYESTAIACKHQSSALTFDEINSYLVNNYKTSAVRVFEVDNSENLVVLGADSKYYLFEIENDIVIITSEMPM